MQCMRGAADNASISDSRRLHDLAWVLPTYIDATTLPLNSEGSIYHCLSSTILSWDRDSTLLSRACYRSTTPIRFYTQCWSLFCCPSFALQNLLQPILCFLVFWRQELSIQLQTNLRHGWARRMFGVLPISSMLVSVHWSFVLGRPIIPMFYLKRKWSILGLNLSYTSSWKRCGCSLQYSCPNSCCGKPGINIAQREPSETRWTRLARVGRAKILLVARSARLIVIRCVAFGATFPTSASHFEGADPSFRS